MRLGISLLVLLALAPAAHARARPQVLVDRAPATTAFSDAVLEGEVRARAAAATPERVYRTAQGIPLRVSFASGYEPSDLVAQSYVDFLGDLPRGDELDDLRVVIAPPADVAGLCGGDQGTLACYSGRAELMIVPGQEVLAAEGVSTSYVLAHEYGHHVAANRDNRPFDAFHYGPKRWASVARVCDLTLAGRIVPGDLAEHYFANPGEAWAEVYAQLKYPGLRWRFIGLLNPGDSAVQAALRDVLEPWSERRLKTFTGRFTRRGRDARRHVLKLTLDGTITVALDGPRRAGYDLEVTGLGGKRRTRKPGADDALRFRAACRRQRSQKVTVTVRRRSGSGPYTLKVRYPG